MASTPSDRSTTDRSAASDRATRTATTDRPDGADRLRIDRSVFAALGADPAPVTVAEFVRWFGCFATAGRSE